jgi:hypothetical protein
MASPRDFSPWVPFDLYDFFGYLFPGVTFSFGFLVFVHHTLFDVFKFLDPLWEVYSKAPFLVSLFTIVVGIIIFYVMGHFIATFSHMIIDRVLVDGIVGYPVNHLLRLKKVTRGFSQSTYKYLFLVFNLFVSIPIFVSDYKTFKVMINILLIIGIILIIIRVFIMLYRANPWRRKKLIINGIPQNKFFKFLTFVYLSPATYFINPIIAFFQKLLGIDKRFPPNFIRRYKELFKEYYGIDPNTIAQENYWLSFFRVSSFSQPNTSLIKTWLHLYGFSRNSSAAAYLTLTVIAICFYFYPSSFNNFGRLEVGILYILASILGIRYWLLYSSYYTKNIIRAFVEVSVQQTNLDKSKKTS